MALRGPYGHKDRVTRCAPRRWCSANIRADGSNAWPARSLKPRLLAWPGGAEGLTDLLTIIRSTGSLRTTCFWGNRVQPAGLGAPRRRSDTKRTLAYGPGTPDRSSSGAGWERRPPPCMRHRPFFMAGPSQAPPGLRPAPRHLREVARWFSFFSHPPRGAWGSSPIFETPPPVARAGGRGGSSHGGRKELTALETDVLG